VIAFYGVASFFHLTVMSKEKNLKDLVKSNKDKIKSVYKKLKK
jgi:hypothetical protein